MGTRGEIKGEGSSFHSGSGGKKRKWKLCSGLFVFLKQKIRLERGVVRQLISEVLEFFGRLVWGNVRSYA